MRLVTPDDSGPLISVPQLHSIAPKASHPDSDAIAKRLLLLDVAVEAVGAESSADSVLADGFPDRLDPLSRQNLERLRPIAFGHDCEQSIVRIRR